MMIPNEKRRIFNNVLRIALLILLPTAFLLGCKEEVVQKEPVRPVKVFKAGDTMGGLTGRSFPGRAAANEEVNLGFEVGGILIKRPVDKGDEVKKGKASFWHVLTHVTSRTNWLQLKQNGIGPGLIGTALLKPSKPGRSPDRI